jgi:hypothetical protein
LIATGKASLKAARQRDGQRRQVVPALVREHVAVPQHRNGNDESNRDQGHMNDFGTNESRRFHTIDLHTALLFDTRTQFFGEANRVRDIIDFTPAKKATIPIYYGSSSRIADAARLQTTAVHDIDMST